MPYYYGVVYFNNGEVSIGYPVDSLDKCIELVKNGIAKHPDKIKATSYITRSEKIDTMKMFGCPKTRNLINSKKIK